MNDITLVNKDSNLEMNGGFIKYKRLMINNFNNSTKTSEENPTTRFVNNLKINEISQVSSNPENDVDSNEKLYEEYKQLSKKHRQIHSKANSSASFQIENSTSPTVDIVSSPCDLTSQFQMNEDNQNRKKSSKKSASSPRNLSIKAIKVMQDWFFSHLNYPYPTGEEKRLLAIEGGLSENQVKYWFTTIRKKTFGNRPFQYWKKLNEKILQLPLDKSTFNRSTKFMKGKYRRIYSFCSFDFFALDILLLAFYFKT